MWIKIDYKFQSLFRPLKGAPRRQITTDVIKDYAAKETEKKLMK